MQETGPDAPLRAKRMVQRARQDAALKVLQRVGYTVDFSGTAESLTGILGNR
jgi:hypothetical protein